MPGENFPGDRIVSLVDELEGLIEEAKPPFGKNAQFKVIDADVFFNIRPIPSSPTLSSRPSPLPVSRRSSA